MCTHGNMGVLKMTREHLGIVLGMNIPFFIVLTKLDISPKNVTEQTLKDLKNLFLKFAKNKKLRVNKSITLCDKSSNINSSFRRCNNCFSLFYSNKRKI